MAVAPLLYVALAGAAVQGAQTKAADDYNAKVMDVEGRVSGMQSNEAANTNLRQSNQFLGRSTAAAVESGGGVGGSTGAILHQSAANAELDALNVRYQGLLRKTSFDTQAGIDQSQGQNALVSSLISGAGGVLKSGYGKGGSADSTGTYSPGDN